MTAGGMGINWTHFVLSSGTSDLNIGTLVATLPGIIGSVVGLVGLVPVHCVWVRQQVGSASSNLVYHRVKLSKSVHP